MCCPLKASAEKSQVFRAFIDFREDVVREDLQDVQQVLGVVTRLLGVAQARGVELAAGLGLEDPRDGVVERHLEEVVTNVFRVQIDHRCDEAVAPEQGLGLEIS